MLEALLILSSHNGGIRLMVQLEEKDAREQVIGLLEENRAREAFQILKTQAEVKEFYPSGSKLPIHPQVTLIEDLI